MTQRNKLIQWDDKLMAVPQYYEKISKYVCLECDAEFGVIDKKTDSRKFYKCPSCQKHSLESYILGAPSVSVKGNITTLGQLADANTKKLGRYGKEKKDMEQASAEAAGRKTIKAPKTENLKRINKLANMTPEQKKRYIHTGEGL